MDFEELLDDSWDDDYSDDDAYDDFLFFVVFTSHFFRH